MTLRSKIVGAALCGSCLVSSTPAFALPGFEPRYAHGPVSAVRVSKLLKRDRERIAQLLADGKREVTLVIAASPGANEVVARRIVDLGGSIKYRRDDLDYLRVKVPIERAYDVARIREIVSCNVDAGVFYNTGSDEAEGTDKSTSKKPSPPDKDTPAENPYLPTRDMGGPQFMAKHPTWDGRGTTIAIVEGGYPDVLTPELQTATDLEGKPTRKLAGVAIAADPEEKAPFQVRMRNAVIAGPDLQMTVDDVIYKVPRPGHYRIGALVIENPQFYQMLAGAGKPYPVLLDEAAQTVWVDTNQNKDFADEQPLSDYNRNYEFGLFGKDDPATPLNESVAFTVIIDSKHELVHVLPSTFLHMTAVAGVAAGKSFFGGKMSGAAPEAQVVAISVYPITQHNLIHGLALAMQDPRVDVVSAQIASRERLNDGTSTLSIIWDRLVSKYKKPVFMSAGNTGPGVNTGYHVAAGDSVISVGGYVGKETWWANYGVEGEKEDYIINLSARGPRADGGFKPDIVAPLLVVSTSSKFVPGGPSPGTYELPPGYRVGAGTSSSSPMAAGGAALLISAAKQTGIPYDSERLARAIKSSSRFLPGYGAHEQGAGLMNIPAAWEALKQGTEPVDVISRATVSTVQGPYLHEPNQGPGIFEREGWRAGQKALRSLTFTRTSGPKEPVAYRVIWKGNDGTFNSPEAITLPLYKPVRLPVKITPETTGVHSSTLALEDVSTGRVVYQVLNTVIASEQFRRENGFTVTKAQQRVEYPGYVSYFFNVPNGVGAFRFEAKTRQDKNLGIRCYSPSGAEYLLAAPLMTANRWKRTIQNPEPGVWEVVVTNSNHVLEGERTAAKWNAEFSFTASIFGVDLQTESSAGLSRDIENRIVLSNSFAPFEASIPDAGLGSVVSERVRLPSGSVPIVREVDIPENTAYLNAEIGAWADRSSDVDLYLYDCTKQECLFRGAGIGGDTQESVFAAKPAPGKWRIVIDPVTVRPGGITINYQDGFTNPIFGSLTSSAKPAFLESRAERSFGVTVKSGRSPGKGRYLAALLTIAGEDHNTLDYAYFLSPNGFRPGFLNPTQRPAVIGSAVLNVE